MSRFISFLPALALALMLTGVTAFAQTPNTPPPLTLTSAASPSAPPAFAPADGQDIADLRGIWVPEYQKYFWRAAIVIAAVLIVSGLVWWLWRWWKNRKPALTLYQRVMLRLQQCRELIVDGNAKLFSGEVSDIVRGWLERRFAVPSTHQTTEEFFQTAAASADGQLEAHLPALQDFLVYCDMAKFAKGELSVEQMNLMWESAKNFVETTSVGGSDSKVTAASRRRETTADTDSHADAHAAADDDADGGGTPPLPSGGAS